MFHVGGSKGLMIIASESYSQNLNGLPPLKFLHFSVMTVSDSIRKKKLKIKFASKKIEAAPKSEASEIRHHLWMNDEYNIYLNENKEALMKELHKFVPHTPHNPKLSVADSLKVRSPLQGSSKRGPPGIIDFHKEKRQKMDHRVKQQCGRVLQTLMVHPASFGFTEPVDPVKLNIPDYFSIITKPMDLGTINAKLQDNKYCSVEEFAADVRLTFSNAITYNPSFNHFSKAAKKLESMFNSKWKSLEAKWKCEIINVEESCISSCRKRKTLEVRHSCPRKSPVHVSSLPKTSMSIEGKRKLKKELVEAMRGKMNKKLWTFLQQLNLIFQKGEITRIEIDGFDDATLLELQRLVKGSLDARAAKADTAKMMQNGRYSSGKVLHKGTIPWYFTSSHSYCTEVAVTFLLYGCLHELIGNSSKCYSCGNVRCQCSGRNDSTHAPSMDLSSERSLRQDRGVSKMEHEVKSTLTFNTRKSDPESDGAVSVLNEGNICSSPQLSTLCTTVTSADGWTPGIIDVQLSPKKALRAAMLKSRFADTILKAKQKTLLENDEKVDPVKLQQEKERLERQQQEEKTRIEAQIRAAEVASTLRAQEELKMWREREREAARIALQKIEKTVEIDENLKFLKELEMFSRGMSSGHLFDGADKSEVLFVASEGDHFGSPLERLGLFIKDDYMADEDEEDELILGGEEGEILS